MQDLLFSLPIYITNNHLGVTIVYIPKIEIHYFSES